MRVMVVSVPVSDQDKAAEFYTGTLGFKVTADAPLGEGMRWVMLEAPDGGPALTLVTWFESMPAGSLNGLVLAVADVEKTHAELSAKGVEFPDGVQDAPWGRFVTLTDPDGNGLVLQEAPKGQQQ
jgi:catechol 2,3-dioxygenase-like lactoylglutathione lyase family enzyme